MSSHADIILEDSSAEEHVKRLRLRKVYIKLRVPRVKAEIAALATRKRALNQPGSDASKEVTEERIFNNQHMIALRTELESLGQEREALLNDLRKIRLQETETPQLTLVDGGKSKSES